MGQINVNQGASQSIQKQKPQVKPSAGQGAGVKPAESSAAQATPGTGSASHEKDPFQHGHGGSNLKDKLEKLPPSAPIAPFPSFGNHNPAKTVERVLNIGIQHSQARENGYMIKTPDVEFHLAHEMEDMTPGEMDDLRDAIVGRMASPDTSQREREVLKRMYDFVDNATDDASGLKPDIKRILDEIRPHIICVMPEPPGGFGKPGKPASPPPSLHQKQFIIDGNPGKPQIQELDLSQAQQQEILQKLKQLEK